MEPDTSRDREGWMHGEPDRSPNPAVRAVYFNAYANQDDYAVNPNSAALGSAFLPYPTRMFAILGVWKDCNKDGYIGQPEGLLQWYPSALLADTSVCSPQPQRYGRPDTQLVHNDGAWVRELLVIAPHGANGEADAYFFNIDDPSARIWGDWNLPEEGPIPTCPLTPLPRGTFQSTGGFLRYADCHPAWRTTQTVTALAELAGLGLLSFGDAPKERPDRSGSVLNQPNPWGKESDASYATLWACDKEPLAVPDATGQLGVLAGDDGDIDLVREPSPRGVNLGGSPAGTVNETEEGVLGREAHAWLGSCDRSDDAGSFGDVYQWVETGGEGVARARTRTDFEFRYNAPTTYGCVLASNANTCAPDAALLTGEGGMRCLVACVERAHGTNVWLGGPGYAASRNPFINRESLTPWGASYATFYAYVGVSGVTLPGGGGALGTYGSDHCDGTAPRTGEFVCEPSAWYRGPNGEDVSRPHHVRVSASYNLRDVDCYDHSPMMSVVPSVLAFLGGRECVR